MTGRGGNDRARGRRWRSFLDQPLATKGLIVITFPLVCLLIALGSVFLADAESRRAESYVRVTFAIQSQILEIHVLLAEGASGVRGYLLSGDEAFLVPFEKATAQLPGVIAKMRPLLTDPDQKLRLDRLEPLVLRKLQGLSALRRHGPIGGGDPTGHLRQSLIENKAVLDDLRMQIEEMREREDALLAERSQRADEIQDHAQLITVLGAIFGILGCVAAIMLMSNGIVRRVRSLEEVAHMLAEGRKLPAPEHALDEIGGLARALKDAGDLLNAREDALRESEERFRLLVEGVSDYGIFGLDQQGYVVSWNSGAERIKGYRADEIVGRHFSQFYPTDTRLTLPAEELAQAAKFGRVENEGWRLRKDGSRFWANVVVTALHDDNGNARGFSKITRDITERKRAEEAILAAQMEAERASEAKSEFLSRISHELRTPLNSILGFAQILEMDLPDPDTQASLAQILGAGRHLISLIDELLDLARIEAGRMEISISPQPTGEIIREAAALVHALAEQRGISLFIEIDAIDSVAVSVDRRRLLQVMLNLLSNAIKFNREKGSVTIVGRLERPDLLCVSVRDSGPGIPRGKRYRIFEPFERLGIDHNSNAASGTGLGLSLSKSLVEAMAGRLEITSSDENGSTFSIFLPVTAKHSEAEQRTIHTAPAVPEKSQADSVRILYIEDNLANLDLVKKVVGKHFGASVLPARQGALGIALAREHRPDLILLDLDLPDIHGIEVFEALAADPRTAAIPVIIVSADATDDAQKKALSAGVTHYLKKPLDIPLFLKTIGKVLIP